MAALLVGPESPRPPAGGRGALQIPAGRMVLPFLIGVGLTLAVAFAMSVRITLSWLLTAFLVGVILAAIAVAATLAQRSPARVAHAASGNILKPHEEAAGGDPLAHIHAVERQGRKHRRPCVNCGTPVKVGQAACPNCGQQQVYPCKGCRTQVRLDWTNCPECGRSLP